MKRYLILFTCSLDKSEYISNITAMNKVQALEIFKRTPHVNCKGKHKITKIMEFAD